VRPVHLTATARVRDDVLAVTARVANALDEPILVRAHPDDGSRSAVLRHRAYSWLEPSGEALHLSLLNPPRHPDIDVFRSVVTLSRRVAGGAVFTLEIRLPLPAPEWNPYFPDPSRAPGEVVQVGGLRVRTGWFPSSGTQWVHQGPEPDTWWAQGTPYRVVETTVPLPEAVPVRRRGDLFRRA
jgi:hypothetical protein